MENSYPHQFKKKRVFNSHREEPIKSSKKLSFQCERGSSELNLLLITSLIASLIFVTIKMEKKYQVATIKYLKEFQNEWNR